MGATPLPGAETAADAAETAASGGAPLAHRAAPTAAERLAHRGGLIELLRVPAALFGVLSGLRRRAYDRGLLPAARLAVPVISVGNLTAGGTGKTPFVAHLMGELRRRGLRPGVLSRGYGSRPALPPGSHPSGGCQAAPDSDEARMLTAQLGACDLVEDPDRIRGGQRLVEAGVDVIVLDDGFQHRRLVRDLDIVLLDATRPFGLPAPPEGGAAVRAFLPRGLLREGPAALSRAQAVVLTRADQAGAGAVAELHELVLRAAPGMALLTGEHRALALVPAPAGACAADSPLDLTALDGMEVDLISAIGNPDAFEASVTGLGARVGTHRRFPDHHAYGPGDLDGLGGKRPLLTTAKDRVKLPAEAPVCVLEVEFALTGGAPVLEALLDALPPSAARAERAALHEGLHG